MSLVPWSSKEEDIALAITVLDSHAERGTLKLLADYQELEHDELEYELPAWVDDLASQLKALHGAKFAMILEALISEMLLNQLHVEVNKDDVAVFQMLVALYYGEASSFERH